MNTFIRKAATSLALMIATFAAHAATDNTSFAVKLTVTSTCDISSVPATDIDFSSHNSTATNVDSTGKLTVNCTNGTPYTIGLDDGAHENNGSRRMAGQDTQNTGVYVPYQLFTDSGRSIPWNNTSSTYGGTGTGAAQELTVYARVVAMNVSAGDYLDTVIATITY